MTLGWAIVGAGKLAETAIVPAIRAQEHSRVAAVLSRDPERARALADSFGADNAYVDYQQLLADPAVDVVYIATPNALHTAQTLAALQAGKHVLVEKPMALSLADGREMVELADKLSLRLGVGFHLRHKPGNRAIRDAVQQQAIGRQFLVELELGAGKGLFPYDTWRADVDLVGGGTLINQGTHMIDLARFLTGERIVSVSAQTDQLPLDDVFAAVCKLESGALAVLASHQLFAGTRPDCAVLGTGGWIHGIGTASPKPGESVVLHRPDNVVKLESSEHSAYWYEVDNFARAVLEQAPVNGDGVDGLWNIAIVEAIYQSAKTGTTVAVPEI